MRDGAACFSGPDRRTVRKDPAMGATAETPAATGSLWTALVVCGAWTLLVLTVFLDYVAPPTMVGRVVLATGAAALFGYAVVRQRRAVRVVGSRAAISRLLAWLLLLAVALPNLAMALVLGFGGAGGLLAPVGLMIFLFGSLYFGAPADLFGERYFLLETVVSPHGAAGILLSALFWIVVIIITLPVLHGCSLLPNRSRT